MLLLILVVSLISFLGSTKAGLYLSVKMASAFLPGHLSIENLNGKLLNNISFNQLKYEDNKLQVELNDFNLKWKLKALLHPKIIIKDLHANKLKLNIKPTPAKTESSSKSMSFNLPVNIEINQLIIDNLELIQGKSSYLIQNLLLRSNFNKELFTVNTLSFDLANLNFNLEAEAKPYYPYTLNGNLSFGLTKNIALPLKGSIKLRGDYNLYYWEGNVEPLNLHIQGTLNQLQDINNLLQWNQLIWPLDKKQSIKSSAGSLKIIGRIPNLKIELQSTAEAPIASDILLEANTSPNGIKAQGLAHFNNNIINLNLDVDNKRTPKIIANLNTKDWQGFPKKVPLKETKIRIDLKANSLADAILRSEFQGKYLDEKLKANLIYEKEKLNAKMLLGSNNLTIEGKPPYQWQLKANLPEPKLLDKSLAGLKTAIKVDGKLEKADKGVFNINIAEGSYQLPEETEAKILTFKGGQLKALLTAKDLNLTGLFTIDKQKKLNLNLSLPQFNLNKGVQPNQKLKGQLHVLINSLNFLESLNPLITKVDGQLAMAIKIEGQIDKPILNGDINLKKGQIIIPSLGLNLNPISLSALSNSQTWQAKASINQEGKSIQLNGEGNLVPEPSGKITIIGDNFPVVKTEEYRINASPNLALAFVKDNIELTGNILIPEAELKPQTFNSTVNLSEDAVYVTHEATPPPNPLHMKTNVSIEMGDKVLLDVKGLHGSLIGGIQIQQAPVGPLNASGELKVENGQYKAYGQDLEIDQGELIFTGGLITNPGIHVKAVRNITNTTNNLANTDSLFNFNAANLQTMDFGENTTVGIEVTGRLKSPKVRLFSNSAGLSQADILSLLILGKPASQANQAGGQLLLNAISALNLDSGTSGLQLIDQLKQSTGLDINIKSKSSYNQQTNQFTDTNAVVVGKSLSKRLYLSYNYGLTQSDVSVLTLTYLLNKFFSIQVNASVNASGIDLLYTKPKE